jgi:hypothetical protein
MQVAVHNDASLYLGFFTFNAILVSIYSPCDSNLYLVSNVFLFSLFPTTILQKSLFLRSLKRRADFDRLPQMVQKVSYKCVVQIPEIYNKGSGISLTATLTVEHYVGTDMYDFSMETDPEEIDGDSDLEQGAVEFYKSLQRGYSRYHKDLFYLADEDPLSIRLTALGIRSDPGEELDRLLKEFWCYHRTL